MRQLKKLLALILALATVCSTLSVTAWASDVAEIDDPDAIVGEEISEDTTDVGSGDPDAPEGDDAQAPETPSQSDALASDSSPIGGAKAEAETSDEELASPIGGGGAAEGGDGEGDDAQTLDTAPVGSGDLDAPDDEEEPSAPAKAPAKADNSIVDSGTWNDLNWRLYSDGILVISGTGSKSDWVNNPWFGHYYKEVREIIIQDGVTRIGDYAFVLFENLTSVTIPNSVTSIGKSAFYGCTSLTSITIPSSVTSMGKDAFGRCTSLTSIIIPNGMTNIGDRAFQECAGLKSIVIPNSVTKIGNDVFANCTSLTSITIPNSVTIIGDYTFYGCTSLTSITIPNSVTSIGEGAFWGCIGLKDIAIPNGIPSIGNWAFDGCTGLTSVTIPNSVTSIGESAFQGCTSLASITIPSSVTSIGKYAFEVCEKLTSVTIPKSVTSIGDGAFGITLIDMGEYYQAKKIDGFTISGYTGSVAETYAKENGFTFKALDKPTPTLSAPALPAVKTASSGIIISWSKVSGAEKYRVYRKTGNGSWQKLGDTTGTTWTDRTAEKGKTYSYTICCVSKDGKTETSDYNKTGKSVLFYLATPSVTTLQSASGGIIINWGKVSGAAKYRVFRRVGSGNWERVADVTDTRAVDRTAKKGTTYTYTVRCISSDSKTYTSDFNKTGKSIKHGTAEPTNLKTPAITNLQNASGGIIINWGKVSGATRYRVFRRVGNGNWERVADVTDTRAVDRTAKKGTTYTYTVRCVTSDSKTYTSSFNSTGWTIKR